MKKRLLSLALAAVMVLGTVPMAFSATASEEPSTTFDYDSLYVSDGLVYRFDAYGKTKENSFAITDMTYGTQTVTSDGQGVPSYGDGVLHTNGAGLTIADVIDKDTAGLTFEIGHAFSANALGETTNWYKIFGIGRIMKIRLYDNDKRLYIEGDLKDHINEDGTVYSSAADGIFRLDTNNNNFGYLYGHNKAVANEKFYSFSFSAEYQQYSAKKTATVTTYNGGVKGTLIESYFTDSGAKISMYVGTTADSTYLNAPLDVSFIRVYNRGLSEQEINQNHFADVAKKYQLDGEVLTAYQAMTDDAKSMLHTSFVAVALNGSDQAYLNAMLANIIQFVDESAQNKAYNELYVQSGLTYMFDAFGKNDQDTYTGILPTVNTKDVSVVTESTSTTTYGEDCLIVTSAGGLVFNNMFDMENCDDYTVQLGHSLRQEMIDTASWYDMIGIGKGFYDYHTSANKGHANGGGTSAATVGSNRVQIDASSFGSLYKKGGQNANVTNFYDFTFVGLYATDTAKQVLLYSDYQNALSAGNVLYMPIGNNFYLGGKMNAGDKDMNMNNSAMNSVGGAMNIYFLRVYDRALTEDEMLLNHVADICKKYTLDITAYSALPVGLRTVVAASFKGKALNGYANAAEAQAELDAEVAKVDLQEAADKVVSFDGFQVRTQGYPALRSAYGLYVEIGAKVTDSYFTVVEVGAIMAVAVEGRTHSDLTVTKGTAGYEVTGTQMVSAAAASGNIVTWSDGVDRFVYATVYDDKNGNTCTKEQYETVLLHRAYVVLSDGKNEYVAYIDAAGGENFPDGKVSMLSLSEKFPQYEETSQKVLEACRGVE